jgi:hypothetical protein
MSAPHPDKKRRHGFDFDEKKTGPSSSGSSNRIPSETARKITSVLRQTGSHPAIPVSPPQASSDTDIEIRSGKAPKKAGPPTKVIVATAIPIRKRIAQSFFRKILNQPELEIESVGTLDEMMSYPNPSSITYALVDGEMQAWETIQMFLQKTAPQCKIKVSMNFAIDFKNFSAE